LEVPVPTGELLAPPDLTGGVQQQPFDFKNAPPVRNPPEEPKPMTDFDDGATAPVDAGKGAGEKYCHECGGLIRSKAVVCPRCGVAQPETPETQPIGRTRSSGGTSRLSAGLLAILLPGLGIHKFILGYTNAGVIMLLVSIVGGCLFGAGWLAMAVISFVEGIIYLTKSEEEFHRVYEVGRREWF
jgi:TM2 domain-containing membrane protein YozV